MSNEALFNTYLDQNQVAVTQKLSEYLDAQRQLAPEDRDPPEAISQVIEKLQSAKRLASKNAATTFQSNVVSTPTTGVEAPDLARMNRITGLYPGGYTKPPTQLEYEMAQGKYAAHNRAAEQGTDIHTGLDASSRAVVSLVDLDPAMKVMALEHLMREQAKANGLVLPDDFPLLVEEPNTGAPAYYRLDEKGQYRLTLVDPIGMDTGDPADLVGDVISAGMELGGAALGTLGTGSGGVGAVAAGAGATLAVYARKKLAEALGLPEDAVEGLNGWIAGREGAMALVGEGAVPVGAFFLRKWKNRGLMLDADDAPRMEAAMKEIDEEVKNLTESTGDFGLNLNMAEKTQEPAIMAATRVAEATAPDAESVEYVTRRAQNERAMQQHLAAMFDNSNAGRPVHPADVVSADVRKEIQRPAREAGELVDELTDTLESTRNKLLAERPDSSAYENFRQGVQDADIAAREAEDSAWESFRTSVGYDSNSKRSNVHLINEPNSPIRESLAAVGREAEQDLSGKISAGKEALLADLERLQEDTLDPAALHRVVSELKREQRRITNNAGTTNWDAQTVGQLIRGIEDSISTGRYVDLTTGQRLTATDSQIVSGAWRDAKETTLDRINIFEEKAVQRLLETHKGPDGEDYYNVDPQQIRDLLLKPRSTEALSRVMGATTIDPTMQSQLLGELQATYAEQVLKDGKYNPAAHNKFMRDYHEHLSMLSPDGVSFASIQHGKQLMERLAAAKAAQKSLTTKLKKTFGTALTRENAAGVANALFSVGTTPKQAETALRHIRHLDSNMYDAVLSESRGYIERRLIKNGSLDADNVRSFLHDHGGMLGKLYGQQYLNDMSRLSKIMDAVQAAKKIETPGTKPLGVVMLGLRSIFGPLSNIQRRITVVDRALTAQKRSKVAGVLSDADSVSRLVRMPKMSPERMLFWQTFAGLFGREAMGAYLAENEDAQEAYRRAQEFAAQRASQIERAKSSRRAGGGSYLEAEKRRRNVR